MKRSLVFIFTLIVIQSNFAQMQNIKPLKIGDKIPATIWNSIPKKKSTKVIILDFWATTCTYCISAFPKMAKLQEKFQDKLQIILINCAEDDIKLEERFSKINKNRKKENWLKIPSDLQSLTGQTAFKFLFPYRTLPHHVWVDETGKVLAITFDYNATAEHVASTLKGKKLDLLFKDDSRQDKLDTRGFIRSTLDSMPPPLFYSSFSRFYYLPYGAEYFSDSVNQTFRFGIYNKSVLQFIQTAFISDEEIRLINELKNKEILDRPKDDNLFDEWQKKYCFSYEAEIPLKDQGNIVLRKKMMQQDFSRFFANMFNIEALIEKRKFNCFILVKSKDGLLKTTAGEEFYEGPSSYTYGLDNIDGVTIANREFSYLSAALQLLENHGRPFIDESGVPPNLKVDVRISGNLYDVENVQRQLHQYGLDILEAEREITVLVVRDKK